MSGRTPYMSAAWKAGVDDGSPTDSGRGEAARGQRPGEAGHAALREGALEDRARQPVDLHEEEAARTRGGGGAAAQPARGAVHRALQGEHRRVHRRRKGHRPLSSHL